MPSIGQGIGHHNGLVVSCHAVGHPWVNAPAGYQRPSQNGTNCLT